MDEDAGWSSTSLLDVAEEKVELRVGVGEAEDKEDHVSVGLYTWHVENPDTGRVFHTNLEILLNWEEVRQLHAYLGFLLQAMKWHT